jgi:hypothetical protein
LIIKYISFIYLFRESPFLAKLDMFNILKKQ